MKVILLKDVDFVGMANELVEVKNGFARNYLIPQQLAQEVNKENMGRLNAKKKAEEKHKAELLAQITNVISVLQANTINIKIKTGTSGKIFGKVTSLQVVKAIKEQVGYQLDRRTLELPEMPNVGTYNCTVNFEKGEHKAEVKLNLHA